MTVSHEPEEVIEFINRPKEGWWEGDMTGNHFRFGRNNLELEINGQEDDSFLWSLTIRK